MLPYSPGCWWTICRSQQIRTTTIALALAKIPGAPAAVHAQSDIRRGPGAGVFRELERPAERLAVVDLAIHFRDDLDRDLASGLKGVLWRRAASRGIPIDVVIHQIDEYAVGVFRSIAVARRSRAAGSRVAAVQKAGGREVRPHKDLFVGGGGCTGVVRVLDAPVAIAARATPSAGNAGTGRCVVAGQCAVAILEPEERGFDTVLLRDEAA